MRNIISCFSVFAAYLHRNSEIIMDKTSLTNAHVKHALRIELTGIELMYMSIYVFNKEQRNHDRPTAVTTTKQHLIKHYFSRCVLNWNFIGYSYLTSIITSLTSRLQYAHVRD